MTTRRRYLVAYDIRDPKRLRRVHSAVRDHGERLQYSLYVCDLDAMEKIGLMAALNDEIKHTVDSVAFIDMGVATGVAHGPIEFMGTSLPLPDDGPLII